MKYPVLLFLLPGLWGCGDDKQREGYPDTHHPGEIRSNERIMEENIRDTTTIRDTTPGAVKFPE